MCDCLIQEEKELIIAHWREISPTCFSVLEFNSKDKFNTQAGEELKENQNK